jgi:hypothetical protein
MFNSRLLLLISTKQEGRDPDYLILIPSTLSINDYYHYHQIPSRTSVTSAERSINEMPLFLRRKSTDSTYSRSSSTSSNSSKASLPDAILEMTLPLAPREDNYNMAENTRQERMLASTKRGSIWPWACV